MLSKDELRKHNELKRRCRLYGSGAGAVIKIKKRNKPLLENNVACFDITEDDIANVATKLQHCFNLVEIGATILQTINDRKFVSLQYLLSLLEVEYGLALSPGELSVLIRKYHCIEDNQINYAKFSTSFLREVNKIREKAQIEREKEFSAMDAKRLKERQFILFPEE